MTASRTDANRSRVLLTGAAIAALWAGLLGTALADPEIEALEKALKTLEAQEAENAAAKREQAERKRAEAARAEQVRRAAEEAVARCRRVRFEMVSDGVLDCQQNVVWAVQDNGGNIDWFDARAYCASLGPGWSLPSVVQLQSLHDEGGAFTRDNILRYATGEYHSTMVFKFVTDRIQFTAGSYWSAEAKGPSEAWYVHFSNGNKISHPQSSTNRALCARRP